MVREDVHQTFIEILKPIIMMPRGDKDDAGNMLLKITADGSTHDVMVASLFSDKETRENVRKHIMCRHITLDTDQVVDILYYDKIYKMEVTPKRISANVRLQNKETGEIETGEAIVDWVYYTVPDTNGVIAEKLIFKKDEMKEFFDKYIDSDSADVWDEIEKVFEHGCIMKIVGLFT